MGKVIHDLLTARGHQISFTIDQENGYQLAALSPDNTDVAIEFSRPESAFDNISSCISRGVKVVSGTTGWLDRLPEIEKQVHETNGTFFYASNYSLGVNLFFSLNRKLAELMRDHDYEISMQEIHHTEKLDQPSGTAITLAEGVIEEIDSKSNWINEESTDKTKLSIISERKPNVPGTHTVSYTSNEDTIEITHTANSRKGFALGAVKVAEWIKDKQGMLDMDDFLKI